MIEETLNLDDEELMSEMDIRNDISETLMVTLMTNMDEEVEIDGDCNESQPCRGDEFVDDDLDLEEDLD